jgi:hypothetical protein
LRVVAGPALSARSLFAHAAEAAAAAIIPASIALRISSSLMLY